MTAWLSYLRLRAKLLLLLAPILLGSLVLAGLTLQRYQEDVNTIHDEVAGLAPARVLMGLMKLTQQHRGLSGTWLLGNEAQADARKARAEELGKQVRRMDELVAAHAAFGAAERDWPALSQQWKALEAAVSSKSIDTKESFNRHTALVAAQMALLDQLLFDSSLILDPEPDTYSLVAFVGQQLPQQIEAMGQLRARGTIALTERSIGSTGTAQIVGVMAQAQGVSGAGQRTIKHALDSNPALAKVLNGAVSQSQAGLQNLMQLLTKEVIEADNLAYSGPQFFKEATQAIDAQYALMDLSLNWLDDTLKARMRHAWAVMWGLLGGGVLLLALTVMAAGRILRGLLQGIHQAVTVAEGLAQGQLGQPIRPQGRDEVADLLRALATTQKSLRGIVLGVREGVDHVSTASAQIAQGNADLAQRTEQQATGLERTTSAMHQMTASVRQNAEHAADANQLAVQANEVAARGGTVVRQVVGTMDEIRASSTRIADIIGVIDGIAFQTNILALNAAVEAARAGEQGRGFAVVAGEVRSLAKRSATAAQEIKQLIGDSVERVATGSEAVREAGATIDGMVEQVRRVAELIGQITDASQEQSRGIADVGDALVQLDQATQRNASLVEESASAALSLRQEADTLLARVAVFRLETA